jgi:hypothetical protein
VRKCLHCPHEGDDETFAHYRDKKGARRPRNVCLECHRRRAADRQAAYKGRHPDRVRKTQRDMKYLKYHSDPDFRAKCLERARKKNR